MKKIFFILFIAIILINCKTDKSNSVVSFNDTTTNIEVEESIKMLKKFYSTFYFKDETFNNKNLQDFVSKRFLQRLDSLNSNEEEILGYDPFIQGQDYSGEVIKRTLKIHPLEKENEYSVSFLRFDSLNEKEAVINYLLKKENGKFLIDAILNDNNFDFKNQQEITLVKDDDILNIDKASINKIFKPYNLSCKIEIYIYKDSLYTILEKNKVKSKGKLRTSVEDNFTYYYFNTMEGVYHNDTLNIQNYGNVMNDYNHFEDCDEKYIYFVNTYQKGN